MPKLNLTTAKQIKGTMGEILALKGPGFSWGKPAAGIASMYGTGLGQINFDLPLHDPSKMTIDGSGYVSAVSHIGGAGPYFNATASGADRPLWDGAGLKFSENQKLTLANQASMAGMHLIAAGKAAANGSNFFRKIAGGKSSDYPFFYAGIHAANKTVQPRVYRHTGAMMIDAGPQPVTDATAWHIMECRYEAGIVTLCLDGIQVAQASANYPQGFLIAYVGGALGYSVPDWSGYLGRALAVSCSGTHSAASPEPAVLACRQELAAKYGITLA